MRVDFYDLLTALGLACLTLGLAMYSEPLALSVLGAILAALGLYLAHRRAG